MSAEASATVNKPLCSAHEPMVLHERSGAVAVLTLNRPDTRNALSAEMLAELADAFRAVSADAGIRAVILAANGPAFCAGHDLKEITACRQDPDGGRAFAERLMTGCSELMVKIVQLPQPVIAAVEGPATAAGCQLIATCDLAVAARTARFCTPGVDIGLFCSTPMVALSRNVGRKQALKMLLTGDMISAEEARRIGLINQVVEPGEAGAHAMTLARKIAAKPAATVRLGKQAFYRQMEMDLCDAYRYTCEVMVQNMMMRDAEEGIAAFVEKRAPEWPQQ